MEAPNSLLGWKYREIDLSTVTDPVWYDPIQPSQSYDWLLHRIQAEYSSDSEDPSSFDVIQWAWDVPPQQRILQDLSDGKPRPPITLCLSMGVLDLTAATTRPKEFFFPSPIINWPIQALEHFTFQVENFSALTGTLKLLYIGSYITPKPVLVDHGARH